MMIIKTKPMNLKIILNKYTIDKIYTSFYLKTSHVFNIATLSLSWNLSSNENVKGSAAR